MTLHDVVAPAKPADAAIPISTITSDFADPATAAQLGTRAKSASDCLKGALSATIAMAEALITHART